MKIRQLLDKLKQLPQKTPIVSTATSRLALSFFNDSRSSLSPFPRDNCVLCPSTLREDIANEHHWFSGRMKGKGLLELALIPEYENIFLPIAKNVVK